MSAIEQDIQTAAPLQQQAIAVYRHSEQRSRGLHTFLRIPLACCFGGNSKGAVTCALDFTDNSEVNDNDRPVELQHKKQQHVNKKKTNTKKNKKEEDTNNNG